MIENSRYSIKPQKTISAAVEAACRIVVVVVILRDAVVEFFKEAQNVLIMSSRDRRAGRGRTATGAAER